MVKKNFRVLIAIALAVFYCFAVGVLTNSYTQSVYLEKQEPTQVNFFSDSSTILFVHTLHYESLSNSFNNLPATSLKKPLNEVVRKCKATEQLLETSFSQYTSISENILIHCRKSNLIFPFHYFW